MKTPEILKIVGKASAIVLLRIVAYTVFGLVLNLIILLSHWSVIFGEESGMMGYIVIILCLVFSAVFFGLGQKQGVMAGVSYIIENRKAALIVYLITKFAQKYPDIMEGNIDQANKVTKIKEYLDKVPSIVMKVLNFFVSRISIVDALTSSVKTANEMGLKGEERVQKVAEIITEQAEVELVSPSVILPVVVLVLNLGLFFI